jgi:hypothetical protein
MITGIGSIGPIRLVDRVIELLVWTMGTELAGGVNSP